MDCFFHNAVPSVAPCRGCKKPICATCRNENGDCPGCVLAARIDAAQRTNRIPGGVGPSYGTYPEPPPHAGAAMLGPAAERRRSRSRACSARPPSRRSARDARARRAELSASGRWRSSRCSTRRARRLRHAARPGRRSGSTPACSAVGLARRRPFLRSRCLESGGCWPLLPFIASGLVRRQHRLRDQRLERRRRQRADRQRLGRRARQRLARARAILRATAIRASARMQSRRAADPGFDVVGGARDRRRQHVDAASR